MFEQPEFYVAVFAGITLMIYWTVTTIGAALWVIKHVSEMKKEIMFDVNAKHTENSEVIRAMQTLVIRHDIILNPEFNNGSGRRHVQS